MLVVPKLAEFESFELSFVARENNDSLSDITGRKSSLLTKEAFAEMLEFDRRLKTDVYVEVEVEKDVNELIGDALGEGEDEDEADDDANDEEDGDPEDNEEEEEEVEVEYVTLEKICRTFIPREISVEDLFL